jgi:hypothetical protein
MSTSTRIAVAIERHVGHAAVCGNRCWLPLGELEGWHVSGRLGLRGRQRRGSFALGSWRTSYERPGLVDNTPSWLWS